MAQGLPERRVCVDDGEIDFAPTRGEAVRSELPAGHHTERRLAVGCLRRPVGERQLLRRVRARVQAAAARARSGVAVRGAAAARLGP